MANNDGIKVSVVIPTYNGCGYIGRLHTSLSQELIRLSCDYEIIFVDDGSQDAAAGKIRSIAEVDSRIKLIRFDKNYGQHNAIYAGCLAGKGNILLILHDDMEGNIKDAGRFIQAVRSGFDIVCGWRSSGSNNLPRKAISYFLNLYFSITAGARVHDLGCGLKAFRSGIIKNNYSHLDAIKDQKKYRFCELKITACQPAEKSRYSLMRLLFLLFDIFYFGNKKHYSRLSKFFIAEVFNL